jgi:hypothetical protein
MDNQEIFKDIPGYEGLYQVSDFGNVKSIKKENISNGKIRYISNEKILKAWIDKNYYKVSLCKNGKQKNIRVHTLVAMTFLSHNPDGTTKIVVDHINNDKLDNRLQNLQLISNRENISKDRKNGSSQYTGVYWNKQNKKWRAQINKNNKRIELGSFVSEYDAHLAYQKELYE